MREKIPSPDFAPEKRDRWSEPGKKSEGKKGISRRRFLQGAASLVADASIASTLGVEALLQLPDLVAWDQERTNRLRFDRWKEYSLEQREHLIESEVRIVGDFIRSREGQRILHEGTDDELFTLISSLPPFLREHLSKTKFDIPKGRWPSVAIGRQFVGEVPEIRRFEHGPREIYDFYCGNGFFVGPRTLLTNWHVAEYSMMNEGDQGVPKHIASNLQSSYTSLAADVIALQFPKGTGPQSPVLPFSPRLLDEHIAGRLIRVAGLDPDESAASDGTKVFPSVALPITRRLHEFFEQYGPKSDRPDKQMGDFVYLAPPGESFGRRLPSVSGSRLLDRMLRQDQAEKYMRMGGTSGSPVLLEDGRVAGINRAAGVLYYKGMCLDLGVFESAERMGQAISKGMVYDIPMPAQKSDRLDVARSSKSSPRTIEDIIRGEIHEE